MTISQEIQSVVRQYHAIHRSVLIQYLMKYFNKTKSEINNQIHKSAVGKYCYELDNGFVAEKWNYRVSTPEIRMSRALRVALDFMGDGEQTFLQYRVAKGSDANTLLLVQQIPSEKYLKTHPDARPHTIQICYIMRGDEFWTSNMMASKPVPEEYRDDLVRIAIVEEETDLQKVLKAGYAMFVRFSDGSYNFSAQDVIPVAKEVRWDDVPFE